MMVLLVVSVLGFVSAEMLVSDEGVEYDGEILSLLETQDEVFVNVDLSANITSTSLPKGTREERIYRLSKIREEVNESLLEVLPFLSEDEFKLKRASLSYASFSGNITKKGFDKLINDSKIWMIRLVETTQTSVGEDIENETVEEENKTQILENNTIQEKIDVKDNENLGWVWLGIIFIIVMFIIILIIKRR